MTGRNGMHFINVRRLTGTGCSWGRTTAFSEKFESTSGSTRAVTGVTEVCSGVHPSVRRIRFIGDDGANNRKGPFFQILSEDTAAAIVAATDHLTKPWTKWRAGTVTEFVKALRATGWGTRPSRDERRKFQKLTRGNVLHAKRKGLGGAHENDSQVSQPIKRRTRLAQGKAHKQGVGSAGFN